MSKTNEVRPIDADSLLDDLQELLNQEVLGNTISDVGVGIEIAMGRINRAKEATLNDLRDAMMSVALRYPDIVMHIHDEMVVEVPTKGAELALKDIGRVMGEPIPWAPGLLLRGDGYLCDFYQKD